MDMHPASEFREWRAELFSIAYKNGFDEAFSMLERKHQKRDVKIYTGLLCELIFLRDKGKDFCLIPTLDCGDHCDFSGRYNGAIARFDVTSSLKYKELNSYSKFQKQGNPYYIVLIDPTSKKIDRIIDINFPLCSICGGKAVNVLIEKLDITNQGTPSPSQRILRLCTEDYDHKKLIEKYSYNIEEVTDEFDDSASLSKEEIGQIPNKIGIDNSLFY